MLAAETMEANAEALISNAKPEEGNFMLTNDFDLIDFQ
jgi:hypothetical protein